VKKKAVKLQAMTKDDDCEKWWEQQPLPLMVEKNDRVGAIAK
jgi:hypothetical protein